MLLYFAKTFSYVFYWYACLSRYGLRIANLLSIRVFRKLIKYSDRLDFLNNILSIYIWLKSNNTIAGRGHMYFYFIVWKTFGLIGFSGLLNKSKHTSMFILPKQWLKPSQMFEAKYLVIH